MTGSPAETRDIYSPHLRTALVLTGQGTAGAYQSGVLRALHEAGVKIDLVAGHGIGAAVALFAATDGCRQLWEPGGVWRDRAVSRFYLWRPGLRRLGLAASVALALVLAPLLLLASGAVVYPIGLLLGVAGLEAGRAWVAGYNALATQLFDPSWLPSLLPRSLVAAVVALAVLASAAIASTFLRRRLRRTDASPIWWRLFGAPLTGTRVVSHLERSLWRLVGGAAARKPPLPSDFCRGYAEMLADNLGQPGFRELLLVVHDLDARRDLVLAMLADRHRRDFFRSLPGAVDRAAEAIDLAGVGRDHLLDALSAALVLPVATEAHQIRFAAESFWKGETHRIADRPGAIARLLEEAARAGAEQVIVVSSCPERGAPHQIDALRGDGRQRLAEYLAGIEAAAVRDAQARWAERFKGYFRIRPEHNPIDPLDFRGRFDPRSDRHQPLGELIDRGYEDAYRQFIDPVVAASGERLGATART